MPTTYSIASHALLGPEAGLLEQPELAAHQRVAEVMLGLVGSSFTDAYKQTAEDAIALQVRFQVEAGFDASYLSSWSHGQRSETYRGVIPNVHPLAAQLVHSLPQAQAAPPAGIDSWTTVTSLRPIARAT